MWILRCMVRNVEEIKVFSHSFSFMGYIFNISSHMCPKNEGQLDSLTLCICIEFLSLILTCTEMDEEEIKVFLHFVFIIFFTNLNFHKEQLKGSLHSLHFYSLCPVCSLNKWIINEGFFAANKLIGFPFSMSSLLYI